MATENCCLSPQTHRTWLPSVAGYGTITPRGLTAGGAHATSPLGFASVLRRIDRAGPPPSAMGPLTPGGLTAGRVHAIALLG